MDGYEFEVQSKRCMVNYLEFYLNFVNGLWLIIMLIIRMVYTGIEF